MTVRAVLSAIALAFTAYLAARGLLWTSPETVERGWLIIAALVLYLPITWLWILLPGSRRPGAPIGAPVDGPTMPA